MAVDAISVVAGGIGIYSFAASLFGGEQRQGANIRVHASNGVIKGANDRANLNTGGQIRNIYGYDSQGILLGDSGGGHVNPDGIHDFKLNQGNRRQALYIDIVADEDAICIPLIGVTQPGGGQHFGWMGDVFRACGLEWYYGNVLVDGSYMPNCGWIDANHQTQDTPDGVVTVGQASFKWYLPSFSKDPGQSPDSYDMDFYCHPRPFEVRYDAQPIEKRTVEQRQERHERIRRGLKVNELIISPHAKHLASEICEDENSLGPDFLSLHEGMFCDMKNKKWYPICDDNAGLIDNCLVMNVANRTLSGLFPHPKALGLVDTLFSYDRMVQWD